MSPGGIIKFALSATFPRRLIVRGPARPGNIALTFDDGPDPKHTPAILSALETGGATATFFVQGEAAERHPDIVRRAHAAGHQIANHGYAHVSAHRMSAAETLRNAERGHAVLERILGAPLRREFRPPYGDLTVTAFVALARAGYRLVFWNYDSGDSFVSDATSLTANVAAAAIPAGSIVLFHDDYAQTAAALPEIIDCFRARGFAFVRIRDL